MTVRAQSIGNALEILWDSDKAILFAVKQKDKEHGDKIILGRFQAEDVNAEIVCMLLKFFGKTAVDISNFVFLLDQKFASCFENVDLGMTARYLDRNDNQRTILYRGYRAVCRALKTPEKFIDYTIQIIPS